MINTIFFDFDGVIVESVDIKTLAFAKLFELEGKDVVAKVVSYHLLHTGVSRYEKFRYIYKTILNRPLGEKEFQGLCDKFAALVVDEVVKAPYVKGAKEFLTIHHPESSFYVLSATPQKEIEDIIKKRGISDLFEKIYGAPNKKSDSVAQILAGKALDPSDTAYVGDALSDYEAARSNSVHFIARINKNEKLFEPIDCPKIKDLTELDGIIRKL